AVLRWQSLSADSADRVTPLYGEFGDPAAPVAVANGIDPDGTFEGAVASFVLWAREGLVRSPDGTPEVTEEIIEHLFAVQARIAEGLEQAGAGDLLVDGRPVNAARYRSEIAGLQVWSLGPPGRVLVAVDQRQPPPALDAAALGTR
ncbi:MAG: hypothetical protein QM582_08945, partial [Micropruina sp.]|uniref:hypothetical protein n=1 Tax=Micropruina sp. TaxID=2737536 RepID=UPI0039E56D00